MPAICIHRGMHVIELHRTHGKNYCIRLKADAMNSPALSDTSFTRLYILGKCAFRIRFLWIQYPIWTFLCKSCPVWLLLRDSTTPRRLSGCQVNWMISMTLWSSTSGGKCNLMIFKVAKHCMMTAICSTVWSHTCIDHVGSSNILRKRHSLIDGHPVWVCDISNDIDFAVLVVYYVGTSYW